MKEVRNLEPNFNLSLGSSTQTWGFEYCYLTSPSFTFLQKLRIIIPIYLPELKLNTDDANERTLHLPKVPEGWVNRANLTVSLGQRELAVLTQWRDLEGTQKRYQPTSAGSNLLGEKNAVVLQLSPSAQNKSNS